MMFSGPRINYKRIELNAHFEFTTQKAIRVRIDGVLVWIPKSVALVDPTRHYSWGEYHKISIPFWFYYDNLYDILERVQ